MIEIHPAGRRERSEQPGITTWHSFSAGAHYDPDNLSLGPIVGVDEHLLTPGSGFDWHAHGGVDIVSWVLEGTLHHEDSAGEERFVGPGALLVQSTGPGIRHRETNASAHAPLRFWQITVLGSAPPRVEVVAAPARIAQAVVDVWRGSDWSGNRHSHVVVIRGDFAIEGVDPVHTGDCIRISDGEPATLDGTGELLIVEISSLGEP